MEILFLILSIIGSLGFVYGIGRMMYSYKELIEFYKEWVEIFIFHIIITFLLTTMIFFVLCAINNTIFHYEYMFF